MSKLFTPPIDVFIPANNAFKNEIKVQHILVKRKEIIQSIQIILISSDYEILNLEVMYKRNITIKTLSNLV